MKNKAQQELWQEFEAAMEFIIRESPSYGWSNARFAPMFYRLGGREMVRVLMLENTPKSGVLSDPIRHGRPDLTVEHYVADDRFKSIFSEDEIKWAKWRLEHAEDF